jgi:hypothetical protein
VLVGMGGGWWVLVGMGEGWCGCCSNLARAWPLSRDMLDGVVKQKWLSENGSPVVLQWVDWLARHAPVGSSS